MLEIKEIIKNNPYSGYKKIVSLLAIPEIREEYKKYTPELTPSQFFFHKIHGLEEIPKCHCGNVLKYRNFIKGYYQNCSPKCSRNNLDSIKRREQTNIEKYGFTNAAKSQQSKEKRKENLLKKIPHESIEKEDIIKEINLEIAAGRKKQFGVNPLLVKAYEQSNKKLKLSQFLYHQYYNIEKIPVCPTCSQEIPFTSFTYGYKKYCNKNCGVIKGNLKTIKTVLKKHEGGEVTQKQIIEYIQENREKINTFYHTPLLLAAYEQSDKKYPFMEFLYRKYKGIEGDQKCKVCGKKTKYATFEKGYFLYCSGKCSATDEEIIEKTKKTNLKKYGVTNAIQNKEVCEKMKKSLKKVNRDKNKRMLEEYKERYKEKSIIINEDQMESYIEGGVSSIELWDLKCLKCGTEYTAPLYNCSGISTCNICYPQKYGKREDEIVDYIKKIKPTIKIKKNVRGIIKRKKGLEYDIFLPEEKIAIEYNGLVFHSFGKHERSLFNTYLLEPERKKNHLEKTEKSEEQGIHLLHIFENEWADPVKQDIWKSIISGKLGKNQRIYARKTILDMEVPPRESKLFLEENHLQGYVPGSIRIGLRNEEGELLSLMTFGKSRYGKKYNYELLRFANKKGKTVIGGASKIFSYFKRDILGEGENIVSYADRRISTGDIYEKLDFVFSHNTSPNYFYFKHNNLELFSRMKFQKHKLEKLLKSYDPGLSESINMYDNGYRKIYDCGNKVYIYKKNTGG